MYPIARAVCFVCVCTVVFWRCLSTVCARGQVTEGAALLAALEAATARHEDATADNQRLFQRLLGLHSAVEVRAAAAATAQQMDRDGRLAAGWA